MSLSCGSTTPDLTLKLRELSQHNPGPRGRPRLTLTDRLEVQGGTCNKRNKNRARRRLCKIIYRSRSRSDLQTEEKAGLLRGLEDQLKSLQRCRQTTTNPNYPRPIISSKKDWFSKGDYNLKREAQAKVCRPTHQLIHRLARGRRYGVVSHGNKRHSLQPNVRGLPPKEEASYRGNVNFKYQEVDTSSLPPAHMIRSLVNHMKCYKFGTRCGPSNASFVTRPSGLREAAIAANNHSDDSRHVVSSPEDGILFDIRRSGAFCSRRPPWETEVETFELDRGWRIVSYSVCWCSGVYLV